MPIKASELLLVIPPPPPSCPPYTVEVLRCVHINGICQSFSYIFFTTRSFHWFLVKTQCQKLPIYFSVPVGKITAACPFWSSSTVHRKIFRFNALDLTYPGENAVPLQCVLQVQREVLITCNGSCLKSVVLALRWLISSKKSAESISWLANCTVPCFWCV